MDLRNENTLIFWSATNSLSIFETSLLEPIYLVKSEIINPKTTKIRAKTKIKTIRMAYMKEFEVKVETLSQAVSFLINNFAGIEKYMNPKYYQVKVGNYSIDETEIHHPIGQEDIHFVPVIQGAGRGLGKILLGGALIALSFGVGGVFANPLAVCF